MDSSRTSITMIELILLLWFILPVLVISIGYITVMGWTNPAKIVRVYSADTNRIDEDGGPYEVEIK